MAKLPSDSLQYFMFRPSCQLGGPRIDRSRSKNRDLGHQGQAVSHENQK